MPCLFVKKEIFLQTYTIQWIDIATKSHTLIIKQYRV